MKLMIFKEKNIEANKIKIIIKSDINVFKKLIE